MNNAVDRIYALAEVMGPIISTEEEKAVKHYIVQLVDKYGGDIALKITSTLETLYGLQMLAFLSGIPVR